MISPEELADLCLNDTDVQKIHKDSLCFIEATVVVFDGLIIWRGDLNMERAIDRLKILADGLGLPVGVIQKEDLPKKKNKQLKIGKFIGPGVWNKSVAWDSCVGLDISFYSKYNCQGEKIKTTTNQVSNYDTSASKVDDDIWDAYYGFSSHR